MTEDLVKRLREYGTSNHVLDEAADRIEQLEAEVNRQDRMLRKQAESSTYLSNKKQKEIMALEAERDQLREQVAELQKARTFSSNSPSVRLRWR